MKTAAVDIGGTAIKYALFNSCEIEIQGEIPSQGILGRDKVVANMLMALSGLGSFDMIGISSAGQVDHRTGAISYATDNIPFYTGTPLKDIAEQHFSVKAVVENDVNAAAIGEAVFGGGKNKKNFLCLTYGTGIGGAIVSDGRIYRGSTGGAAEFGHILTHPGGHACTCGRNGCYEAYASTSALVSKAMELDHPLDNGKKIFEAFDKGEAAVISIVDSWIDEICYGLISLVYIFNPDTIILGGGVMTRPYIQKSINARVTRFVMNTFGNVNIIPATLGNTAGLYGVMAVANGLFEQ